MIAPPVGGTSERFWRVAAHVLGAVIGAMLVGVGLAVGGAGLGLIWRTGPSAIAAGVALIGIAHALAAMFGRPLQVPTWNWFVPRRWETMRLAGPFLFGASLGGGFVTRVPYFGYFVLIASCIAMESIPASLWAMATFGAVRGLSVAIAALIAPRCPVSLGHPPEMGAARRLRVVVNEMRWWLTGSLLAVSSIMVWLFIQSGDNR